MTSDTRRYFIELRTDADEDSSRDVETALRRAQAEKFVNEVSSWLHGENRSVPMAITALGQVQITCEQDVINRLCQKDELPIAAVRRGGSLLDSLQRIGWR